MNHLDTPYHPFPAIWIGGDLGEYRPCDSTYAGYEFASLPPLPHEQFHGNFQWLISQPSPFTFDERFVEFWNNYDSVHRWKKELLDCELALQNDCSKHGVQIPQAFFTFMNEIDLVTRIRSPTDCFFEYPRNVIACPAQYGGYFVHFYSDSQDCFRWYLYIDQHQNCIVTASDNLDEPHSIDFWDDPGYRLTQCATSFESFIYRLWIETEIWHRLVDHQPPLTSEMVKYLGFYGATD